MKDVRRILTLSIEAVEVASVTTLFSLIVDFQRKEENQLTDLRLKTVVCIGGSRGLTEGRAFLARRRGGEKLRRAARCSSPRRCAKNVLDETAAPVLGYGD